MANDASALARWRPTPHLIPRIVSHDMRCRAPMNIVRPVGVPITPDIIPHDASTPVAVPWSPVPTPSKTASTVTVPAGAASAAHTDSMPVFLLPVAIAYWASLPHPDSTSHCTRGARLDQDGSIMGTREVPRVTIAPFLSCRAVPHPSVPVSAVSSTTAAATSTPSPAAAFHEPSV